MAALRGEAVDRVPLSFWLHNFTAENAVDTFVAETLRLAREFDWDYLKPQSRAQCFAEAWGFTFTPSGERATPFTPTHEPCAGAAGFTGGVLLAGAAGGAFWACTDTPIATSAAPTIPTRFISITAPG